MTDQTNGAANPADGVRPTALPIVINAQYLKDLSFESPRAPHSLLPNQPQPQVEIGVDVRPQQLADEVFEVVLSLRAEAKAGDSTVFIVEMAYGGLFTLSGVPAEHVRPVLMIEGPRMLFPFARAIMAETTRDGGFPPLMLNPIDFAELYRRQVAQGGGQAGEQPAQA